MKHQKRIAVAVVALLATSAGVASAADVTPIAGKKPSAYLLDSQGNVVRSGTGRPRRLLRRRRRPRRPRRRRR
jgi:hypothetical protein